MRDDRNCAENDKSRSVEEVDREIEVMFERMQTPEHRRAVDRLFAMTSEELGKIALKYMKEES